MFSTKILTAYILLHAIIIITRIDNGVGDINTNCRSKVLNTWLRYCENDGVGRSKRDIFNVHSIEDREKFEASNKRENSRLITPGISDIADGSSGKEYSEARSPRYPAKFGFQSPASGDDLSMGLSYAALEELYDEIINRLPRAPKNKEQSMKIFTEYAIKCCNDDLNDATCSDPSNVINCP